MYPDVSSELLSETHLLQPKTIHAGERPEHLPPRMSVTSAPATACARALYSPEFVELLMKSNFCSEDDVEFPIPTKQGLHVGPLQRHTPSDHDDQRVFLLINCLTTVDKARDRPSTHVAERVPKPGYGDTKNK